MKDADDPVPGALLYADMGKRYRKNQIMRMIPLYSWVRKHLKKR